MVYFRLWAGVRNSKHFSTFFMGMFLRRVLKFLVIIIGSFLGAVFLVIQWMQARQYIQGQVAVIIRMYDR